MGYITEYKTNNIDKQQTLGINIINKTGAVARCTTPPVSHCILADRTTDYPELHMRKTLKQQ